MAGLGRKVFAPGEVLTATNVQNYLMDQAVQVYAGTAARGSAIGSATTEGMVSWLADTDQLQVATGTATWQDVSLVQSPNAIINGGFDFWQRGTSFSNPASGAYTADRWVVQHNGTGATRTISQQSFTPGTAPVSGYEGQYFFRYAISAAGLGNTNNLLISKLEDVRTFAGETVTYSFWAKADAARTVSFDIERGYGAGGSGQENLTFTGNSVSLTTSWARYSLVVPVPSVTGKTINAGSYIGLRWSLPTGTTQTIDIWGVQLEAGSVATPFRRNAPSIQGELAACQRYYYRSTGPQVFSIVATGLASSTTSATMSVNLPVTMRTAPSAVEWATIQISDIATAATPSSIVLSSTSSSTNIATLTVTATGLTAFRPYVLSNANNVAGYIGVTAEL